MVQILSVIEKSPVPTSSVWNSLGTHLDLESTRATPAIDFAENVAAPRPSGALNSTYTGPVSLIDLDPTCAVSVGMEQEELNNPTAIVGYTSTRRPIDYVYAYSVSLGRWWRSFCALYHLAKQGEANRNEFLNDKTIKLYDGYIEAFLLACGDITLAPFGMKATDDLDIDKVFSICKSTLLGDSLVDHKGFTHGYATSRLGFSTDPSSGKQTALLDRDTVTNLFSHPWRRAAANAYVRPRFEQRFALRRNNNAGRLFVITEGGTSTTFRNDTLENQQAATSMELPTLLTNNLHLGGAGDIGTGQTFPLFAGQSLRALFAQNKGVFDNAAATHFLRAPLPIFVENENGGLLSGSNLSALGTAAYSVATSSGNASTTGGAGAQYSNQVARSLLDGMHGAFTGIDDWMGMPMMDHVYKGTAAGANTLATTYSDLAGNYPASAVAYAPINLMDGLQTGMRHLMVPNVFNTDSPGHITWMEWRDVLNGLKDRFPLESLKIMQATKRLKMTLPNGSMGELTSVGNSTFGSMLRNSMRDGYIAQPLAGFSVTSKLERDSQNGPAVIDGKWRSTSSPIVLADTFTWLRMDDSTIIDSYTTSLSTRMLKRLNHQFVGEYMSGTKGYYAPPGLGERDITGPLGPDGRYTMDLMTIPRDALIDGSSPATAAVVAAAAANGGNVDHTTMAYVAPGDMIVASGANAYFTEADNSQIDGVFPCEGALVNANRRTTGIAMSERRRETSSNLGVTTDGSTGYGIDSAGGTQIHWMPEVGFRRGFLNYHSVYVDADNFGGSSKTWAFDPTQLRVAGKSWRSWCGNYMSQDDSLWVDPYRLDPFVTTSIWYGNSDYGNITDFQDGQALTVGYDTGTPGINAMNTMTIGPNAKGYASGGTEPTEADFTGSFEIACADNTTARQDNKALGFSASGGVDSVIPGYVPDAYTILSNVGYNDGTDYGGVTTNLGNRLLADSDNLWQLCNSATRQLYTPAIARTPAGVYGFTGTTQEVLPIANHIAYHPIQQGLSGAAITAGPQFQVLSLATSELGGARTAPVTNNWSGGLSVALTGYGLQDFAAMDARRAFSLTSNPAAGGTLTNHVLNTCRWMPLNAELHTRTPIFANPRGDYGGNVASFGVGEFKFNGQYLITEATQSPAFNKDANFWLRFVYGVPFNDSRVSTHLFDGGTTPGPCTMDLGALYYGNAPTSWGAGELMVADAAIGTTSVFNVGDRASDLDWHSHGALTSPFLHERESGIVNPWDRASEGEPGIKTYTYESSEQPSIARALVLRLRSRYLDEIASGLTNDLMRDIQVVN